MRTILFCCVVLLLSSCKKGDGEPKLNHEPEKLKAVMCDMYIAAEAIKKMSEEQQDSMSALLKEQIAVIHGVDMSLIEADLNMLPMYPEYYTEFHKTVRDSLQKLEKQINAMKYD